MTTSRCGTAISLEEFFEGGAGVDVPVTPSDALPPGVEVPVVGDFGELCETLRTRTASEIAAILGSRESRERYGESESVLRNVASDFEDSDPGLAYTLHVRNWETYRDTDSLGRSVRLAFLLGFREEAFRLSRIARHVDPDFDPFVSVPHLSIRQTGTHYFDWLLSETVRRDPNRSGYLADSDLARILRESREIEHIERRRSDPRSPQSWENRLRSLEFRSLTLLDPVSTNTLFKELAELAEGGAEFDGDAKSFLAEYAVSPAPLVSEAYYRELSGEGIVEDDRATVAETIYRRFVHVGTHLLDPKFLHVHRNLRRIFVALDAPRQVGACDEVIAAVERNLRFLESLPDSVRDFRNRLIGEITAENDGSFYLRLRTWAFGLRKPFRFRHQGIGALLLVDMISQNDDDFQAVSEFAARLWKLPIIPEIASMVAFAFAAKERYYEAAEWISRSDMGNPENSSLLLRIVAEFRDLSPMAVETLRANAPVLEGSAELALARVRALVKGLPVPLAEEMLGDSESAFGDPYEAVRHYDAAVALGNSDALEKSADLAYELGSFADAEKKYELLLANGGGAAAYSRLCLSALEKGETSRAAAYFAEVDREDPSNCSVVAAYRLATGSPFQGLSDLSRFPHSLLLELSPDVRAAYREYAESLTAELPAEGAVPVGTLPSVLLASRSAAYSFASSPAASARYFGLLLRVIRETEGAPEESAVDETLIGLLAPIHDPSALGFVQGDSEIRTQVLAALLSEEAKAFAAAFQDCLTAKASLRREYSAMLLAASELLGHFGEDLSGFLREAGADALLGKTASPDSVGGYAKITVH